MDAHHRSPPLARERRSGAGTPRRASGAGAEELPPIYERLARPGTREEYFDGELRLKMAAKPPHARRQLDLGYVLRAHVAEGYLGATEMLTRTGRGSDFAPDASVYPNSPDPDEKRELEELAFEVCSQQDLSVPTTKARKLTARGVRRVFCIVVKVPGDQRRRSRKKTHLLEWSQKTDGWSPVPEDGVIEDVCLDPPMPVRALLDAAESGLAVARALRAQGNPVFQETFAEGEAKGRAKTLVSILEDRGFVLSEEARQRILGCADPDQLERWTRRVLTVATVDELWSS